MIKLYHVFKKKVHNLLVASQSKEHPYLLKVYSGSNGWYRLYSDGWCEQGGNVANVAMSGWKLKITFLLPFSDNHYTFVKTPHMAYFHGDASADRYSTYIEKHTDYILSYTEPSSLVPDVDWLATGYVSSF